MRVTSLRSRLSPVWTYMGDYDVLRDCCTSPLFLGTRLGPRSLVLQKYSGFRHLDRGENKEITEHYRNMQKAINAGSVCIWVNKK